MSIKYVLGDMFLGRVHDVNMNFPKGIAAMADWLISACAAKQSDAAGRWANLD